MIMLSKLMRFFADQIAEDAEIAIDTLRPCVVAALTEALQKTGDWQRMPALPRALNQFMLRVNLPAEDVPSPPFGILTQSHLLALADAVE